MVRSFGFETERLAVRPLRLADWATCAKAAQCVTLPGLFSAGGLLTLSQLEEDLFLSLISHRDGVAALDQLYVLSAFLRDDGRFVGDTMLFDVLRRPHPRAEIGTVVTNSFQGMGLGSELIAGTIEWGWHALGLEEIRGFVEADNPQSMVACLKSGFSLTSSTPIPRNFLGEVRWGWPIVIHRS